MKEYIERYAARDLMEQALVDEWEIQYADDRLDEIPVADVAEVKHGRWVNIVHAIVDTTGYCDKCHSQSVWRTRDMAYEICPRCGAKMDKEET